MASIVDRDHSWDTRWLVLASLAWGHPVMIPFLYALATSAGTIVGGILPSYTQIRLIEQRYLVGFAGGATVAIALFDLIPQMKAHNAIALLLGFFTIYLLEKVILVHTCIEENCETHVVGSTALIGIAAESMMDGLAIATGIRVAIAMGFMIALAVFIHEIPRGITISIIMKQAGYNQAKTWVALAIDAGFAPLGVLLQWPTILTAAMFPILVFMYTQLAKREEKDALAEFGDTYSAYQNNTPAFFPGLHFSHLGID